MNRSNYKNLDFYKLSKVITIKIYEITNNFPKEEQGFTGIVNQLRRAGISSASNIAEGSSRRRKEFYYFLTLSLGSLREIETQIAISKNLGFIPINKYNEISEDVDKAIGKLCKYMKTLGKDCYNNKYQN